jgi:hypothetical protein
MSVRTRLVAVVAALTLGACGLPAVAPDDEEPVRESPVTMEYPPIEPVEPPLPEPTPTPATPAPAPIQIPAPQVTPPPAPQLPEPAPPPAVTPTPQIPVTPAPTPAPTPVPEVPPEDLQLIALLGDLQRYNTMPLDDAKRELNTVTQTFTRQRTDPVRVRLAMLYVVVRASPQDDLRALQLLENVAKSPGGSVAVKQLAAVLQVQISERMRAVREEQLKADAAIQKLEALRAMERSLLRDRARGGGGGGGGGGSGGGGGGGGAGGGK